MDGISRTDFGSDEQRAIAMLAEAIATALAMQSPPDVAAYRVCHGSGSTPEAEQCCRLLRRADAA
jgi:hypothetical protein